MSNRSKSSHSCSKNSDISKGSLYKEIKKRHKREKTLSPRSPKLSSASSDRSDYVTLSDLFKKYRHPDRHH